MGFMDKFKDAARQAQDAMQSSSGMGAGDMGEMQEMQQRYQKLNASGIERRATITAMDETGRKDFGGSPEYSVALQIKGDDGPYETTINQFMHPDQLQHFPVGKEIGVRVDPDDPNVAVLWG